MEGFVRELKHQVDVPIRYTLQLGYDEAVVNEWLGKKVTLSFLGERRCVVCGRMVHKLYQSGYCFPCVTSLAETDLCIVKPHECHYHLGTCRDSDYAQEQCMIPHYVYLAVSSQVKVGLTRKGREWTRWVDQGAHRAMLFAELPTRKAAGEFEMQVAKSVPDKTDWRKLVQGIVADVDLDAVSKEVALCLPGGLRKFVISDRTMHEFHYPVLPGIVPKAKSLSLEKDAVVEGTLVGVRGQYLLFPHGVLNVKKHAGLLIRVQWV